MPPVSTAPPAWPKTLLMVGCGNMGGAMLQGWLVGGFDPARVTIVDPVVETVPEGVMLVRAMPEGRFDAVLLGVKPQILGEVAPQVAPLVTGETVVLSILAGVELATLSKLFPDAGGAVRIMPNLAASLGKSPVALAASGLDPEHREAVTGFMQPLGTPEWFEEADFDLVTALAGSGPAFVYRFIDALSSGAAGLGLEPAQAQSLAIAMVEGASQLAAASDLAPGALAKRVASPGGTTQAGLDALDREGAFAQIVEDALAAARDRSEEMAREARS